MTNANDSDSKKYELMVIINAEISEDQITKKQEEIKKYITDTGGEIFSEDIWGVRQLTYKIKRQTRGHYSVLYFVCEPEKISDIEEALQLDKEIIRYLLQVIPAQYEIKLYQDEINVEPEKEPKEQPAPTFYREKPVRTKKTEKPEAEKVAEKIVAVEESKIEPEKIEAPTEPKKEEVAEQPKEEKKKPKKPDDILNTDKQQKEKLKEFDAKLQDLINNPDIDF